MWLKIRAILGVLTDLLLQGRRAGLWNEKNSVTPEAPKVDKSWRFKR